MSSKTIPLKIHTLTKTLFSFHETVLKIFNWYSVLSMRLRIWWLYLCWGVRPSPKSGCPGYCTELNLVLRLLARSSGECEVYFAYHYSQVHSNSEWLYLLESRLYVRLICLQIIYIRSGKYDLIMTFKLGFDFFETGNFKKGSHRGNII